MSAQLSQEDVYENADDSIQPSLQMPDCEGPYETYYKAIPIVTSSSSTQDKLPSRGHECDHAYEEQYLEPTSQTRDNRGSINRHYEELPLAMADSHGSASRRNDNEQPQSHYQALSRQCVLPSNRLKKKRLALELFGAVILAAVVGITVWYIARNTSPVGQRTCLTHCDGTTADITSTVAENTKPPEEQRKSPTVSYVGTADITSTVKENTKQGQQKSSAYADVTTADITSTETENTKQCDPGYFGWECRFQCQCGEAQTCDSGTGECEGGCPSSSWGVGCLLDNDCSYNDRAATSYMGKKNRTINYHICGSWTLQNAYPGEQFPDKSQEKAENFCRNPWPTDHRSWCYYQFGSRRRWDYCTLSPCVCPLGRYGPNCDNDCHCANFEEVCNATHGSCQSGCDPGWVGPGCQELRVP